MSIINEALKKTQLKRKMDKEKREQVRTVTPEVTETAFKPALKVQAIQKKATTDQYPFLFTWQMAGFLTVSALLAILGFEYYQRINQVTPPPPPPVVQAVAKPANKIKVVFEGVLIADNTRIALINKESMHIGDTLNGMTIVAISQDTVDLQSNNGIIQLRAGATYLI